MATIFRMKRTYEPAAPSDGFRVLVDRLWPRGLSKENFHYDLWERDIAPSNELRQWFHADPEGRWEAFERKYRQELIDSPAFAKFKAEVEKHPVVTLLYSSRDQAHNNAEVVEEALETNA